MRAPSSILTRLQKSAFAPVDIASLAFFRIAFGVLMIWIIHQTWSLHRVEQWWIQSPFLFKYPGFSWVQPWPGNGLYIHWIVLGVLAFFIAIGFLYRVSALLFFLSRTYFFLLDQGRYVNHVYLICLLSFLLIFAPAHRAFSIDAWLNPRLRSQTIPAWPLWLLRIQMAVVYFFAGIAKLTSDWLHGEPMRWWLNHTIHFPFFDQFLHGEWAVYASSYGALLLDLFLAPFLFWRRTRVAAFFVAVIFHLLNAQIFPLDVFPWLAIAATTLFLSPSWPRRLISFFRRSTGLPETEKINLPVPWKRNLVLTFVALYAAIQVLVPLRHFLYRGGIEWTYMEHRFSWQMMIELHIIRTFFYVTDPNTYRTVRVTPERYLDIPQIAHMGWRPDMVWQFGRYLGETMPRLGPKPVKVEVRMFVSINGRKPRIFLDPNVDLAAEPRPWGRPRWLLKIDEPLPPPGQDYSQELFSN